MACLQLVIAESLLPLKPAVGNARGIVCIVTIYAR